VKFLLSWFCGGLDLELVFNYVSVHPVRSEVFHAKTSPFLFRNESNSISFSGDKSWEIITALYGTLGSSGTLLVSHSGSTVGLLTIPASLLVVLVSCQPLVSSLCKPFTFLWLGAKSCSMFLASF
jgi:hypothetical protein